MMDFPSDISGLSPRELGTLASEIRTFLIEKISKTGGHLASNLGIVELTLAAHKVFDIESDEIVFDVGHQSYVHKILTGRADGFGSLRKLDGLSGFPKRGESPYDTFDSGHSSNSISIAMGIAEAKKTLGEKGCAIAIIGDGALTGGEAYEGLNNVGSKKSNVKIILNDNQFSISKYTGMVAKHLRRLRVSHRYLKMKKKLKRGLLRIPGLGKITYGGLSSIRNFIRRKVAYGSIFEELGFKYYGPVDGHDISELVKAFLAARENDTPTVIHCITKKGKGYLPAENLPDKFHGVSSFDAESGLSKENSAATYSDVYGEKLCELAEAHDNVVGVTAAMTGGTGMDKFSRKFPERFYDTAIAESHAVSFAGGLALKGMKPFLNIYSTFLQRAYDNVMMDVCLMRLPVVFVLDRAGLVGEDGETHQGVFDISYLSHMPNMTIIAPSSKERFLEAMDYAYGHDGPVAIRIPRGEAVSHKTSALSRGAAGEPAAGERDAEEVAGAVVILAFGRMVEPAAEASERMRSEGKKAVAFDMHFVKPLDENFIIECAQAASKIVTVEDNVATGGVGERIASLLERSGTKTPLVSIAFPDKFIEHGATPELFARYKMDADGIYQSIMES